jgi:hypothetical protein
MVETMRTYAEKTMRTYTGNGCAARCKITVVTLKVRDVPRGCPFKRLDICHWTLDPKVLCPFKRDLYCSWPSQPKK